MPGQHGRRHKVFLTGVAGVRLLQEADAVLVAHVGQERGFEGEAALTQVALERCLPCVDRAMAHKVAILHETFPALFTPARRWILLLLLLLLLLFFTLHMN
jgi:hypothetical protein